MQLHHRRGALALAGAALAAPALVRPARAQKAAYTLRYANNQPLSHPMNVRMLEAIGRIRDETGGQVGIDIFPAGQLGLDPDVLGQLRSGAIDLFSIGATLVIPLVGQSSLTGMPYIYTDYPAVWRAMDGDLGAYLRAQFTKVGLVAMDRIWDNGFRQTTTNTRPISSPDDLKGLKIRVAPSPLFTSFYKALGAGVTVISFGELYQALQTGLVNAQENALIVIQANKLYEVQRYCSLTRHMWDGFWLLANGRSWETLPEDLRATVARNLNRSALDQRADVERSDATLQVDLERRGVTFNVPDPTPFKAALKQSGFYAEWKTRLGAEGWAVLERSVGPLV